VILDEMNLAKVEYYFADFLSAMETTGTRRGDPLHDQEDDVVVELDGADASVPRRLPIRQTSSSRGTVNIDETTHMFSRKVLDRATSSSSTKSMPAAHGSSRQQRKRPRHQAAR